MLFLQSKKVYFYVEYHQTLFLGSFYPKTNEGKFRSVRAQLALYITVFRVLFTALLVGLNILCHCILKIKFGFVVHMIASNMQVMIPWPLVRGKMDCTCFKRS